MRVIGIDPGLRHMGWGIIEHGTGGRLSHVASGVIVTKTGDLAPRLLALAEGLREVIALYRPEVASVEKTFVNRDPAGALKLGHARAIALLAPAEAGLPVSEYAPNEVKKTVVGVGHADKDQVAHMVKLLLPGAAPKTADAADALAIAICHAQHAGPAMRVKAPQAKVVR
ncbi:MAG: crossover junction endodeoxyribonuclease RuvC [Pikeienuella sp.]